MSMWIFFFFTCALIQCYDTKALLRHTILQTMLEDPVLKNCNSSLLDDSAATFIQLCNIQYKSDISDVDDQAQLLCLSYYDINRRLCEQRNSLVPHNTVALITLLSNITAHNLSCEVIQNKLTFGNLPNIQNYATTLKTYLSDSDSCRSMCFTLKSHLKEFCKIFFWGNVVLSSSEKQSAATKPHTATKNAEQSNENSELKPLHEIQTPQNSTSSANFATSGQDKINLSAQPSSGLSANQNIETSASLSTIEPSVEKLNVQLMNNHNSSLTDTKEGKQTFEKTGVEENVKTLEYQKIISTPHTKEIVSHELPPMQAEKAVVADIVTKKKVNLDKDEDSKNNLSQQFQEEDLEDNFDDEDPIQNEDEEFQEGNRRKPIQLPQSPDNSNIMLTQTLQSDIIQNQNNERNLNEHQNKDHRNGYITGSLPVDEDAEEGHFFFMFLSLVGLSALVYILFHNKNKILGLLVEGRVHSTRRRGSHAYSRLNTLEHAVATPAPPAHKATILY